MGLSVLALGLMFLVFSACPSNGAITCNDALTSLIPCRSFLVGSGPEQLPSHDCCVGAQNVFKQSGTTKTRRALCQCLKQFAVEHGVKPERANLIPQACKVDNPIPIGPPVDCSK
jgi:hypothetical protein